MKKLVFSGFVLFACMVIFAGCIKNTPYTTTLDPYLRATIGSVNFNAKTVVPSTLDTQNFDTSTTLIVTANTTDLVYTNDQIVLAIANWKGQPGVFSIIQSQAGAIYDHHGIREPASNGIVAVTRVTQNSIIGYFNFTTVTGVVVTNGEFLVGRPWKY